MKNTPFSYPFTSFQCPELVCGAIFAFQVPDPAFRACDQTSSCTHLFSDLKLAGFPPGKSLRINGMGNRPKGMSQAANRYRTNRLPNGKHQIASFFLLREVARLASHREQSDPLDVVFLRHLNLGNGQATWETIFAQTLEKLPPHGRIIITFSFDREHDQALQAFKA